MKSRRIWTEEKILKVAKKYQTNMEFRLNENSAYQAACKLGVLEKAQKLFNKNVAFCPVGETMIRKFFEEIFEVDFPKKKFDRDPKLFKNLVFKKLELDGYNEDLGIAFEHQGSQHYALNKHVFKDKNLLKRDKAKALLCQKQGIKLVVIPDIVNILKLDQSKIKAILELEFNRLNIEIPKKFYKKSIDLIMFFRYEAFTEQDIVALAKKERCRVDFCKKHYNLYKKLVRIGKWDSICFQAWKHNKQDRKIWDEKSIQLEANKYNRRVEFKRGNLKAYRAAIRRGILQQVCRHMPDTYVHKNKKLNS